MNFYEVDDPYYALIAAHNEEECLDIYTQVVSEVEDEDWFFAGLKSIRRLTAVDKVAESFRNEEIDEKRRYHESVKLVYECETPKLLLMDQSIK